MTVTFNIDVRHLCGWNRSPQQRLWKRGWQFGKSQNEAFDFEYSWNVVLMPFWGGRNRIGRREKWPKQSWEEGEIGGKSKEEGEKEKLTFREEGEIGSKSREGWEIGSESRKKGDLPPVPPPPFFSAFWRGEEEHDRRLRGTLKPRSYALLNLGKYIYFSVPLLRSIRITE